MVAQPGNCVYDHIPRHHALSQSSKRNSLKLAYKPFLEGLSSLTGEVENALDGVFTMASSFEHTA